jgi:glycosyltransferase involved in cell wall biosynthesis
MHIAMLGTRGVPARYGGFETAVEEIGRRLVTRGHEVVVYCRGAVAPRPREHLGMRLVHLPAARKKSLETLSHTGLSVAHLLSSRRAADAAIVFNSANAPFLPALRLRGVPAAVHVDGLEWRRAKWQGAGRTYYRAAESLAVRWGDALIADAQGIADYYAEEFGAATDLLAYGAPIQAEPGWERIDELGLLSGKYHVVVARFEPENHVLDIVQGYARSTASMPLVVVGSAPYADDYTAQIRRVAEADSRINLLGGVWDQEQLDQLYANSLTYVHGHSVGGTNPSLLRAMGGGAAVLAYDVVFNREVLGGAGRYFSSPGELARLLETAESAPDLMHDSGRALRARAQTRYRWDEVADGYESLLTRLAAGESQRGRYNGRRRGISGWGVPAARRAATVETPTWAEQPARERLEDDDPAAAA